MICRLTYIYHLKNNIQGTERELEIFLVHSGSAKIRKVKKAMQNPHGVGLFAWSFLYDKNTKRTLSIKKQIST